ncbi:hypothetical protein SCP_1100140 [Sparassis crispa]|uniref:Uncharacterized protein n=1 Tax=Sparassis crispa TaxID=139825 RepID=A0A401GYV5_9APHY|nr:hypothetical protein SCP_1100140 [Sparassis crispa]GBE87339.1 hypothetical protein SCP_1100140 [Sparassis crispa]
MSHLLYNTGHRPYTFELPGAIQPLTPPETDNDYTGQAQTPLPRSATDYETHTPQPFPTSAETSTPLGRRGPSVTYVHSGPRESRERVVQRGPKWLVVVIPPPSFTREHGQLGHTLSNGSPDRLSHGLLMPLFYTMGGQLSAIAREYGLPSSVGLCLYLRTNQSGLSLAPRISDESWQLLWGHLFEARSPTVPVQQLPISGQIEFEIDMSKARWYDTWLTSYRKDVADVPYSVTHSRRQSVSHWRGDSRTTFIEDDQLDQSSLTQQARAAARIAPKKLSLLDRFDTSSAARAAPHLLPPPSPNGELNIFHALSPIVQEVESPNPKNSIDNLVNSWRVGAALSRSPLAPTGQTSLDPANMPNTLNDLRDTSTSYDAEAELDLDEYTWSISSAGPPDYDESASIMSWVYPPSVHLDRRLEGSVCLTPSICTSFGPPDDDYQWSVPSTRLPTPDIAWRALEDAPLSPSVCTSPGPPDDDDYQWSVPSTRVPSPDIAWRALEDAPLTPSTCTSFGPPDNDDHHWSTPSTRLPSPDIALRVLEDAPLSPLTTTISASLSLIGPPSPPRHSDPLDTSSPGSGERALLNGSKAGRVSRPTHADHPWPTDPSCIEVSTWSHIWPYYNTQCAVRTIQGTRHRSQNDLLTMSRISEPVPWKEVWPYVASLTQIQSPVGTSSTCPHLRRYPAVYPFFDLYPALPPTVYTLPTRSCHAGGEGVPAPEVSAPSTVGSSDGYPYFNLYPAVFPFFDLYPTVIVADTEHYGSMTRDDISDTAPWMHVWPYTETAKSQTTPFKQVTPYMGSSAKSNTPPWKHEWPYTGSRRSLETVDLSTSTSRYPTMVLYPAVYPFFDLYPAITHLLAVDETRQKEICIEFYGQYPVLQIYKPVYPHVVIYPSVDGVTKPAKSELLTNGNPTEVTEGHDVQSNLSRGYPIVQLYPAVYPSNLDEIYPRKGAAPCNESISLAVDAQFSTQHPDSPVYPYNLDFIYPWAQRHSVQLLTSSPKDDSGTAPATTCHMSAYPALHLYPAADSHDLVELTVETGVAYPHLRLYPAVDPFSSTYPATSEVNHDSGGDKAIGEDTDTRAPGESPANHFAGQTAGQLGVADSGHKGNLLSPASSLSGLPKDYPSVTPYPAVHPWNLDEIYPAASQVALIPMENTSSTFDMHYPRPILYPAVYPASLNEIYPSVIPAQPGRTTGSRFADLSVSVKLRVTYPIFDLYPSIYPHNILDIYPSNTLDVGYATKHNDFNSLIGSLIETSPSSSLGRPCNNPAVPMRLEAECPTFVIYPSVYPFLDIYPPAAIGGVHQIEQSLSIPQIAITNTATLRRVPRFTHMDLHMQVFSSGFISTTETSQKDSIARRSTTSPVTRLRSRSGTISSRFSLSQAGMVPAVDSSPVFQSRVPSSAIPDTSSNSTKVSVPALSAPGEHLSQPPASRGSIGLPAHPAVNRRLSSAFSRPISSSFSALPTLIEPEHLDDMHDSGEDMRRSSSSAAMVGSEASRTNIPRPIGLPPRGRVVYESQSATLPQRSLTLSVGADLSRAKTLPSRRLPLMNRAGSVLEKARAFDQSGVPSGTDEEQPHCTMMSALAQFPSPPLPPLPTESNGRLVSKLDRSKYPFS